MRNLWEKLNLTQKFGLMAGLVMIAGMLTLGFWVTREIERGVTLNAGINAALYMDTYVAPLANELRDRNSLSFGPVLALDEVFNSPLVKERLLAVKIWKPDGTVLYANDLNIMGKKFDLSEGLVVAAGGKVFSRYFPRGALDEIDGMSIDLPVMEIYSPVRMPWSNETVAVLEFYEDASVVADSLVAARFRSWMVVGVVVFAMSAILMVIVHSGSVLIERQRRQLLKSVRENAELAQRVERASGQSAELSERHLRRVSADLHDGPAQLVSLAALRIGGLPLARDDKKTRAEVKAISGALDEAMQEIRDICRGLSLPEIEYQSLNEIISNVTSSHTARTSTSIELDIDNMNLELKPHEKICIYRFFQEGLSNAFRHGKGKGQKVQVKKLKDGRVRFAVMNDYDGNDFYSLNGMEEDRSGLGLLGLEKRVLALGGEFGFECSVEKGACLEMVLNIESGLE